MSKGRIRGAGAVIMFATLLYACSGSGGSPSATIEDREQHQVAVLKSEYKDVVMGTDVKGRTLSMFVDMNNMSSMDESAEADMKTQALALWARVWSKAHPHAHAALRLSVRDYCGREVYSATAHV